MVYKSQVDKGAYIIPICVLLLSIVLSMFDGKINRHNIWIVILLVGLWLLFIFINATTIRYVLTESELIVKSCMYKTTIKTHEIKSVKQIKGVCTAYALSMNQLELSCINGRKLRISPQEIEEFEEQLRHVLRDYN